MTCPEPTVSDRLTIGTCTGVKTGESCELACSEGYSGTGLTVTCNAATGANSIIDVSGASCSRNSHDYFQFYYGNWRRQSLSKFRQLHHWLLTASVVTIKKFFLT